METEMMEELAIGAMSSLYRTLLYTNSILIYNQSINQFICPNAINTGPDTKGGCNLH